MGRILRRAMLVVLAAAVVLFLLARLRYSGKVLVRLPAESCDADLWKHIYQPERLYVIEACTAVEGRVVTLLRAWDGDLHIGLDPEPKSVLNLVNLIHGHGQLVVEIICEHAPARDYEKAACGDFRPQVMVPKVGDRVRVTGAYVTDLDNGWNELHPVTRIEELR